MTAKFPYLNQRLLICVMTGFSSGLPLYVLLNLLPAWLHTQGVSLKAIGLFSLINLPYAWKFLWAYWFDKPRHCFGLGRRRWGMLLTQSLLLISLALFGYLSPVHQLGSIALLALMVAFLSASQDIVLDAYRCELLLSSELGLGNAIHVNAYRLAALVPGSLALILSSYLSWQAVFVVMALCMLPILVMTLYISEPNLISPPQKPSLTVALSEFMNRQGWQQAIVLLAFVCLYKLGDSMATALATPFYLEKGFSLSEIGIVAKQAGLWANILGGVIGGIYMLRVGILKALWLFGIAQALAILGFIWLAISAKSLVILGTVVALEALCIGLGTIALVAFIAHNTHPSYTATQFALLTGLTALPRTFANATTGWLVASLGWTGFFVLCFALALPGMVLLHLMIHKKT